MKKTNRNVETIVASKTINSIDELVAVVEFYKIHGYAFEYVVSELDDWSVDIGFNENLLPRYLLIEKIFLNQVAALDLENLSYDITITKPEFEFLKQIQDEDVQKLLFFALVYSKAHDHPSHWIKYERDLWFNAMGMRYKESKRKEIMSKCLKNGLELRVIGTKQPIVCYKVNFRMDEGCVKTVLDKGDPLDIFNCLFGEEDE